MSSPAPPFQRPPLWYFLLDKFVLVALAALCVGAQTCYANRALERVKQDYAGRGEIAKTQGSAVLRFQAAHDSLYEDMVRARRMRDTVGMSPADRGSLPVARGPQRSAMDSAHANVVARMDTQTRRVATDGAVLRGTPYVQLFRAQVELLRRYYFTPRFQASRDSLERDFRRAYESSSVKVGDFSENTSLGPGSGGGRP